MVNAEQRRIGRRRRLGGRSFHLQQFLRDDCLPRPRSEAHPHDGTLWQCCLGSISNGSILVTKLNSIVVRNV